MTAYKHTVYWCSKVWTSQISINNNEYFSNFKLMNCFPFQHLIERSWYAVTETCLAFTVFRDDFSPRFVAQFTLLLFLKCFHWLAEDRIDYMERSPLLTWLFHVRAVLLLMFLGMVDAVLVHVAYNTTMQSGASVQLVFGFEVRNRLEIPHKETA